MVSIALGKDCQDLEQSYLSASRLSKSKYNFEQPMVGNSSLFLVYMLCARFGTEGNAAQYALRHPTASTTLLMWTAPAIRVVIYRKNISHNMYKLLIDHAAGLSNTVKSNPVFSGSIPRKRRSHLAARFCQ